MTATAPDPATSPALGATPPAAHESILRCVGCGAQLRVASTATQPPRCPACGALVPQIADRFQLRSIPTLSILRAGAEVDRVTGARPPQELARVLSAHL